MLRTSRSALPATALPVGTGGPPPDGPLRPTGAATAEAPPYTQADIDRYLLDRGIQPQPTGDQAHDMCLFQAVLFGDLFDRIDSGLPAAHDPARARDTAYLLRRFDDLARPLATQVTRPVPRSMRWRVIRRPACPPRRSTA